MRRAGALTISLVACAALVLGCVRGAGPLPPLGPTFNPGSGVWTAAAGAAPVRSETLHLAGLRAPVQVAWDASGVPHVRASDDDDAFMALGYVHARDRLLEMDLERRQAEGRLAEILGPSAVPGDELQLDLGLARTADADWRKLAPDDGARRAITAYTAGVNARIEEEESTHRLPMLFTLLGYAPQPWRPQDTMALRGLLAEDLAYEKGPLYLARLRSSLGPELTASWFPTLPPNAQHPYAHPAPPAAALSAPAVAPVDAAEGGAAGDALARLQGVGHGQLFGASNSWAVDGAMTASGKPLMANDPHLALTLPSIWYQVSLSSPGYDVSGVTIPGAPVVLIGRNRHISWGATDTQAQTTLYYRETTSPAHPGAYLWKGGWRSFDAISYDIPVRGAAPVHHTVRLSVHGPLLTEQGQTLAVDWVADSSAPRTFDAILGMMRASSWGDFSGALRDWVGPIQNWTYADDAGHIGAIAPGTYPIVGGGDPSLPLAGTGEDDVVGAIPFAAVPRTFDPPSHVIVTANQRPVGPDYPYFIGGTVDTFDPGYRASEILSRLDGASPSLTAGDMQRIQTDVRDDLAVRLLPALRSALASADLSGAAAGARGLLDGWDAEMTVSSPAATIWNRFQDAYLDTVFGPWWSARHVPVAMSDVSAPLIEDLDAWTLHDPGNAAFTPPGGPPRTAPAAMVQAFRTAVSGLARSLGPDPAAWRWGRVHTRAVPSLTGIPALGYGPVPSAGDVFTPDAAGGSPSVHGPSWRMVVDWGDGASSGVYPGGQSENAASANYDDQVADWLAGRLRPMRSAAGGGGGDGATATWTLRP